MSFSVTVDISGWTNWVENLKEKFSSMGEFISQFADSQVIQELESESGSQRKVHTGTYSGTWEANAVDQNSAEITTDAYYWSYLEYGTRKIAPKPVVQDVARDLQEPLTEYLINALNLD